jgi:hypothetical protein
MAAVDAIELETKLKDLYRHVAEQPHDAYHFETGRALAERLGYPADLLDRIPGEAIESFAGSATSSTWPIFARVIAVRGELQFADASREPLDARRLTAPAETGLRLLSLATVVLAATLVAFRI